MIDDISKLQLAVGSDVIVMRATVLGCVTHGVSGKLHKLIPDRETFAVEVSDFHLPRKDPFMNGRSIRAIIEKSANPQYLANILYDGLKLFPQPEDKKMLPHLIEVDKSTIDDLHQAIDEKRLLVVLCSTWNYLTTEAYLGMATKADDQGLSIGNRELPFGNCSDLMRIETIMNADAIPNKQYCDVLY